MLYIFKLLCKIWAKLKGWTYDFHVPEGVSKAVVIVAPHTSNWDFIVGIAGYDFLTFQLHYFGKQELFRWPIKGILNKTGGIPVSRVKKENWVEIMVKKFHENEEFFLVLAPEGTRGFVEKWRSGFYQIALAADVPILTGYIDYDKRKAGFGPCFNLTGDKEKDYDQFRAFFNSISPKIPENYNPNFK